MCQPDAPSTKFDPPDWTKDIYPQAMNTAVGLANRPYDQYQSMRVAPVNPWQHTAGQLTVDRAMSGDPQTNAARSSLMSISQGGAQNPYMDNAYTNQMVADTAGNMADAFASGTGHTNNMLAARSGAFGGSAHLEKQAADAAALARQVGQMGTAVRQQDIGRKGALWGQDVGNVMQAASMAPGFSQLDQQSYDALKNYGDFHQNYTQSLLGEDVNEFNRQQNFPLQNLDLLFSALAKGSGQYGTNFANQPGQSGLMNGIGGGMGLLGLLGGL